VSDAEALAWLRGHGRMEISVSDLARAWRWTRPSTYRRLDRWADEGRITKTGAAGGRWVVSAVVDKPDSKQSQEVVAALMSGRLSGMFGCLSGLFRRTRTGRWSCRPSWWLRPWASA